MKKDAERSGADVAPISLTGGTESGSGVVSMRTCWLNLVAPGVSGPFAFEGFGGAGAGPIGLGGGDWSRAAAYWVLRAAMVTIGVGVVKVLARWEEVV